MTSKKLIAVLPLGVKKGDRINGRPVVSSSPQREGSGSRCLVTYEDGSVVTVRYGRFLWVERP